MLLIFKFQIEKKKCFSIISRLEMILSVVSYEKKNISLYKKIFELTKNNTSKIIFAIGF